MAKSFTPEQLVSPRDIQRDFGKVLKRLKKHGSLLVVNYSKPVAILSTLDQDDSP